MFVCFFLKNSLCSNTIIWDLAVLTNCLYCWCMSTINWLASMVCFSPSLFSNFYLNYLKPIWVFSHFIRYLQSLLEPHLKFCTFFSFFFSFFFLSFLVSLCVQEQFEETYIMVKPDAMQLGLVSFTLICLQFLTNLFQIWLLRKHRGKV